MQNVTQYNNTSFPVQVTEALNAIQHDKDDPLRYHQRLVTEYVLKYKYCRGLLIYHKMGAGKTRLAAAISEALMKADPKRRTIFISAKSLHDNFKNDLRQYLKSSQPQEPSDSEFSDHLAQKYRFVSMNASNMIQQVYKATQKEGAKMFSEVFEKLFTSKSKPSPRKGTRKGTHVDTDTDTDAETQREELRVNIKKFKEEMEKINALENLDGTTVIIDEAHNLFNSVTNGSRNALMLYYMLLHANDIKILFMSGSPIVNDPFELAVCFNALAGLKDGDTLFGDNYQDFSRYFIDNAELTENESQDIQEMSQEAKDVQTKQETPASGRRRFPLIKNKSKFMNRITGLISYFGADSPEFKALLPEPQPMVVERVPMSQKQYTFYLMARDKEMEETKRSAGFKGRAMAMQKPGGASSSYRVMSRQISNFLFPDYASKIYRNERGQIIYEKRPDELKPETFDRSELSIYSPKLVKLLENLALHLPKNMLHAWRVRNANAKSTPGPGLVYSQFVESGVEIIARALEHAGMRRISSIADLMRNGSRGKEDVGVYAVISGETPPDLQEEILKAYNLPENADASIISVLLVTVKGAEGINLFTCKHEHMYEAFWHYARVEQFFDRAIRPGSLSMIPKTERKVYRYVYLADYPESKLAKKDPTTGNAVGMDSEEFSKKSKEIQSIESTTDITLFGRASLNNILRTSFFRTLQESSLDCALHYGSKKDKRGTESTREIKCRICLPTDKPLYVPDLRQDMKLPSSCEPMKKEKIKAKAVSVNDREYMYTVDDNNKLHVFERDDRIDGYQEIFADHPEYYDIYTAIKSKEKKIR